MLRSIIAVLTITNGILTLVLGFAPNPSSTTVYHLGDFWPQYAGSWLLSDLGVSESNIIIIALVLSIAAGLALILAGLGLFEIVNFGTLIEEFTFIAVMLSLTLFICFYFPLGLVSIILDVILVLYLMFFD